MKRILIFSLLAYSIGACSQTLEQDTAKSAVKKNNSLIPYYNKRPYKDTDFRKTIKKKLPKCQFLLHNENKYQDEKVIECFNSASLERAYYIPLIVNIIVEKKQAISHKILTKILENIAQDPYVDDNPKINSIRKLIKAGASTKAVKIPNVRSNTSFSCKTLIFILKRNKAIYQQNPVRKFNRYDLQILTDTSTSILCPKAIDTLIDINPKLRNIRDESGITPLNYYLYETTSTNWSAGIAKKLMTKENINVRGLEGDVPLYSLLHYDNKTRWDKELIKYAIKLGADINLINQGGKYGLPRNLNKHGISVRDMILKRPDLRSIIQKK